MPNCDFYALPADWLGVFVDVFANPGWCLYELASEFDTQVVTFRSVADVSEALAPHRASHHFQLYAPAMAGQVQFRRTALDPDRVPGKRHRFTTEGWGLIQLSLSAPRDGVLRACHTNHNSQKRAEAWAATYPELGDPAAWNWRAITAMSSRLNRAIRKRGVATRGPRVILPAAHAAVTAGQVQLV